jgi:hypothetical protein
MNEIIQFLLVVGIPVIAVFLLWMPFYLIGRIYMQILLFRFGKAKISIVKNEPGEKIIKYDLYITNYEGFEPDKQFCIELEKLIRRNQAWK